jgi:hypothetical protein
MSIAKVGAAALRLEHPAGQADAAAGLPVGRPLVLTIVAFQGGDRWLAQVGERHLTVSTTLQLAPGDRLEVEAASREGVTDFRLRGMAARFDQSRYDAAVLQHAGGTLTPVTLAPRTERLLALVDALLALASGSPAGEIATLAGRIADRLQPLDPRQGPAAMADRLRAQLQHGGLLLEPQLAQELDQQGLAAIPGRDLRALAARLAARLSSASSEASRPPSAAALSDALQSLTSDTLARQLDLALQWLRDGALQLRLPVTVGGEDRQVEFLVRARRESTATNRRRSARKQALDVQVDVPALGRLRARVRWLGSHLSTVLHVERAEVADLVRAEVASLAAGLKQAGFRTVATRIVVDPAVVAHEFFDDREDYRTGGSIFRARA